MFLTSDPATLLPNGTREAMLRNHAGNALLIVEGLYHLHLRAGSWLTRSQLIRLLVANFGMGSRLIQEGLQQRNVFQRRVSVRQAHQRGRPPYLYRIPHPDELTAEYAPDKAHTPHDPLRKRDLRNLKTYRMALHHALVVRLWSENGAKGFEMARGLMADRLGVSPRTVRTYDRDLGHSHTPNFKITPIGWYQLKRLPRYPGSYRPDGSKRPSRKQWLRITDAHGTTTDMPFIRFLGWRGLRDGHQVAVVERQFNTYYPYQRPDESRYGGEKVVDFYYDDRAARHAAGLIEQDGQWVERRE